MLSPMEAVLATPQRIIDAVLAHVDNAASIRNRLKLKTATMTALAERNFDLLTRA